MATFSVNNLSFGYRRSVPVFKNVSFSLSDGEALFLEGPNGAGKSTLMAVLAGLLEAHTGSIQWEAAAGQRFSYLASESNGHFLNLDALSNLRYWAELHNLDSHTAALLGILEAWNLAHPRFSQGFPVRHFSTGMKRRLAFARLHLLGAPLLLLDEPMLGLDVEAQQRSVDFLTKHLQNGGMLIFISHESERFRPLISKTMTLGG